MYEASLAQRLSTDSGRTVERHNGGLCAFQCAFTALAVTLHKYTFAAITAYHTLIVCSQRTM